MAHEVAKLLLEHAGSFLERTEAVKTALRLGMHLAEIEEYLDWLDATRGPIAQSGGRPAQDPGSGLCLPRCCPGLPTATCHALKSAPTQDMPTAGIPSPFGRG